MADVDGQVTVVGGGSDLSASSPVTMTWSLSASAPDYIFWSLIAVPLTTPATTQTTSTLLSTSSSTVGISQQPIPSGFVAIIAVIVVLGAAVAFVFLRRRKKA